MLLRIEPDGPVPIFQQLRDRIVEAIATGEAPVGARLPATRQLAVDLGINFHTVSKGYDLLRLFGVVMCVAPQANRPRVQFGVRVPPARLTSPVIRRARRGYLWCSAVVAICATGVLVAVGGQVAWPSRVILLVEIVVD